MGEHEPNHTGPYPLPPWKRAVIKVGSALLAPEGQGTSTRYLLPLARLIAEKKREGKEIVLVSSGAVAAGRSFYPKSRPGARSLVEKQALAAMGQTRLMQLWSRFFDFPCAQILLTHDDIHHRKRFVNAKNTLLSLLGMGALPIVNENDTVAVEELKVGDNDNLAAHVAVLIEADLLLIFSDIDGLYDADPRKNPEADLIREVHQVDGSILCLAGGSGSSVGTGGMITKLQAAGKAADRGINTVILNGKRGQAIDHLLNEKADGTFFHRTAQAQAAKKHWISHALQVQGTVEVDAGARRALLTEGASLLPSGVTACSGSFQRGDAVTVVYAGESGEEVLGKGIVQYNHADLNQIKGGQSSDIRARLGYAYTPVIIHRNDLVTGMPVEPVAEEESE
ncbi:glutamate 5-kinase [Acanthopleuribacter pedis]|uniref:Glutamate 5-kinase n=1 Tax=Acanthopleuribacter pedis TaxID=442870 RepID=A0A8J7QKU1_9BACT|nr:glutamate 5-kinase [Acanthopleuribacter pedis]MBO1321755.1 glutamate 5-kinase [Acanthopleuribacter pedis]